MENKIKDNKFHISGFYKVLLGSFLFIFSITIFVLIKSMVVGAANEVVYSVSAAIGTSSTDTNAISLSQDDTASIEGWETGTSRYININVSRPEGVISDDTTYILEVKLPIQFYFVGTLPTTSATYAKVVSFTVNEGFSVNAQNGVTTYSPNSQSGTLRITIDTSVQNFTCPLVISYDDNLWGKFTGKRITPDGVYPLEISILSVEDNVTSTDDSVHLYSVTSGAGYDWEAYNYYSINNGVSYSLTHVTLGYDSTLYMQLQGNDYGHIGVYRYYKELVYTVSLPYITCNGTNYYLEYVPGSVSSAYGSVEEEYDEVNHKVSFKLKNVYFSTNSVLVTGMQYVLPDDFPRDSEVSGKVTFDIVVSGKDIADNEGVFRKRTNMYDYAVTFMPINEDVEIYSHIGKMYATVDMPIEDGIVVFLGNFQVQNVGAGDSSEKTINVVFDTENTKALRVTTMNLPSDTLSEYLQVSYKLIDANGEPVTIDGKSSWTISIKNAYYGKSTNVNANTRIYRSMLPEEHQKYFFKEITYDIKKIPASTLLFLRTNEMTINSGGCFYGYFAGAEGVTAKSTMTISSPEAYNIDDFSYTFNSIGSYCRNSGWMLEKASISSPSITAGESSTLRFEIYSHDKMGYAYYYKEYENLINGGCGWLDDITVGIVLPDGMSLNEESISAVTNKNIVIDVESVTCTDSTIDQGYNYWEIKLKKGTVIGLFTESLSALENGKSLIMTMTIDTDRKMDTTSVQFHGNVFIAGDQQENIRYTSCGVIDRYDINNNSITKDYVIGLHKNLSTLGLTVNADNALLDITDTLTVKRDGEDSSSGKTVTMYTESDIVEYSLNIYSWNDGKAEDFIYYLPIVKSGAVIDEQYMISEADFSFDLLGIPNVTGNDIYEFEYSNVNLGYDDILTNSNITWYTANDLNGSNPPIKWADVTLIKITLKAGEYIESGYNTTISLDLKYNGSDFESDVANSSVAAWKSSGYYTYFKADQEVTGHFPTSINTVNLKNIILKFKKVDDEDNSVELSGAEFNLYRLVCNSERHNHDEVINVDNLSTCWELFASDIESPEIYFSQLYPDTVYRLIETEAPFDRIKPAGQWSVVTSAEGISSITTIGNALDFVVVSDDYYLPNARIKKLPSTGVNEIPQYSSVGIVLMILSIGLLTCVMYSIKIKK